MQYKSQHFVPKCYMRPFSTKANKRSINLYNLRSGRAFENASIKNQCAKDYFYDRTGEKEGVFNDWEGRYSETLRTILERVRASEDQLEFLRYFAYLQHLRTEAMAVFQVVAMNDMANFVFEGDAEGRAWAHIDPTTIPGESLGHFISTAPYLADLKDCIVVNQTGLPFITSDNPAVAVNRFYAQKGHLKFGGSGLLSSGYMLILPLSPSVAFVSYDKGVYSALLDGEGLAFARRARDVEALNALQVVKAVENVYFHDMEKRYYVENLVSKYKARRPDAWHKWHFAVERPSEGISEFSRFEVIKTPAKMREGRGLMHLHSAAVDPGIWCSLFAFRNKPVYFDTQSVSGPVRSQELWNTRQAHRTYPRIEIPRKPS